ncbi:hypothetical protein D3C72_727240 [compost metagenome]
MTRQPLQVDARRVLFNQQRFAAAGTAANQHHRLLHLFGGGLDRGLTQGFVAAHNQRVINAHRV